ncbi:MAG: response regulator [Ferruginibacter sp.]|nr:response regulator [Cytophagales bacterium]
MNGPFENSSLRRQLKKHLGDRAITDADWLAFLGAVDDSYNRYEEDRDLLEKALELSSLELIRVKDRIQLVSDQQKAILDKLQGILLSMQPEKNEEDHTTDAEILLRKPEHLVDLLEREIEKKRISQEQLRQISDAVPGCLYRYRADREGNPTFLFMSKGALDLFGYSPEQLIGNIDLVWSVVAPEDVAALQASLRVSWSLEPWRVEFRVGTRTGEIKWLSGTSVPEHNPEDSSVVWSGIFTDITPLKRIENELRSAMEAAEQATLAKSQFLSAISHEIRTPLNAVIGITHLLREDPKPEQIENLNVLRFSAENLLVLINDVLDFSKIEAGKVTFEEVNFRIEELGKRIVSSLASQAAEKGIRIKFIRDSGLPPVVAGDPVRLAQVLTNLLGNAVKFTHSGTVALEITVHSVQSGQVQIDFRVSDTGIGIAPEQAERIFERFTQASSDTTRKFGGTGLGLAITKGLLELQNSRIHLESELGKGSVFSFRLAFRVSADREDESRTGTLVPSFESLNGLRLLLVEDNSVNQFVAKKFLHRWNAEVDVAEHGIEALEKVAQNQYDLILMDLQMPEMDGYQAAMHIRASPNARYNAIPIIALTASSLLEIREKIFAAGMNDYVSKPFNPNELYGKITKYAAVRTR